MIKELKLNDIKTAPKDGTFIILFWGTPLSDSTFYNVRESKWWKPKNTDQWEKGARPHWEYLADDDFIMEIKENDILGWLPVPESAKSLNE